MTAITYQDVKGNNQFEKIKLIHSLILNFISRKQNKSVHIDTIAKKITIEKSSNVIGRFENYIKFYYGPNKNKIIGTEHNGKKYIGKFITCAIKYDNKTKFLNDIIVFLEKELLDPDF